METVILNKSTKYKGELVKSNTPIKVPTEQKELWENQGLLKGSEKVEKVEDSRVVELEAKVKKLENKLLLKDMTIKDIKALVKDKLDIGDLTDKDDIIDFIVESDFDFEATEETIATEESKDLL